MEWLFGYWLWGVEFVFVVEGNVCDIKDHCIKE